MGITKFIGGYLTTRYCITTNINNHKQLIYKLVKLKVYV